MTSTEPPALSVVVPVFNGESFISRTVRELISALARLPCAAELLVVDDGSTDATLHLLETETRGSPVRVTVLRQHVNQGKGAAIALGMQNARGLYRVFVDADLAYPPEAIADIWSALERGTDIAVASRVHPESRLLLKPRFITYYFVRHLIGRFFNTLVRLFLLPGLADSQAGLKGFRAAAADRLFSGWLPRGFSFDVALLLRARRLGLRIEEVPVLLRQLDEPSSVRFVRDTSRMLRDLVSIRLRLVGDRFESWGRVVAGRWNAAAEVSLSHLRAPVAAQVLAALLGSSLIVLVIARTVLQSAALVPLAWAAGIVCVLLLAWRRDLGRSPRAPRLFRLRGERLCFLTLLAFAAALRFAWLGDAPTMVHGDSAECGLQGLAILRGEAPDLFSLSGWYQTPFLSYVPYALSFWLFGISTWSLALPSAILGTATLVPLYFLSRRWFGIRAAMLTVALFALSHAAIHFSRIGLWNIQIVFYEVAAFSLLAGGFRRRHAVPSVLAGVVTGLALYGYTAGRLIPIIALAFLASEARRESGRVLRAAGAYLAGIAVTIAPLLLDYAQNPSVLLVDRASSVWVFADANQHHVEATLGTDVPAAILWHQVVRTLGGFLYLGDSSAQYGTTQPLLSPVTAVLALGGLLLALRHWREARFRFLLLWLGLGLFLGSVVVIDPPSYTRLVVLLPAFYCLIAAALVVGARRFLRRYALGAAGFATAAVLVVVQSGAFDLSGYYAFNEQMRVVSREWDVLKMVQRLGDRYDYYLYTGPFLLADSPVFRLFSSGTRAVSAFTEADLPERLSRDAAFLLTPEFRRVGVRISDRFPGADRDVLDDEGVRQMIVYRCSVENGCRRGPS
jgi:4-amino-4-deoxy-L-arabinose transferase-like glycosyltransferase